MMQRSAIITDGSVSEAVLDGATPAATGFLYTILPRSSDSTKARSGFWKPLMSDQQKV